jgi:competence protein ComEA
MSIREYLTFTRRERIGILTLTAILVILAVLPHFFPGPPPSVQKVPVAGLENGAPHYDSSATRTNDSLRGRSYQNRYPARRYYGDYGDVDRYANGNHYRRRTWNNNNYGKPHLRDSAYTNRRVPGDSYYRNRTYATDYAAYHKPYYSVVDINAADTTALIALPGIGSKLAARIVAFRNKLGGFHSVAQIKEVYGLRDSVFTRLMPYLKCDSLSVKEPPAPQKLSFLPRRSGVGKQTAFVE